MDKHSQWLIVSRSPVSIAIINRLSICSSCYCGGTGEGGGVGEEGRWKGVRGLYLGQILIYTDSAEEHAKHFKYLHLLMKTHNDHIDRARSIRF